MNDDLKKALSKIKKCLALSESSNPHEAANALRQAQAMMKAHGLDHADVELSEILETTVSSSSKNPPEWENWMCSMIADQFGIAAIVRRDRSAKASIVFVGIEPKIKVAEYAFVALRRQMRKDSNNVTHWNLLTAARKKAFYLGWIAAVANKVQALAEPFDNRIEAYLDKTMPDLADADFDKNQKKIERAIKQNRCYASMGYTAGKDAHLHSPVHQDSGQLMIGGAI